MADLDSWTLNELIYAFKRLKIVDQDVKFCFFVARDVVDIFMEVCSTSIAKACVSRQGWVPFEQSLGNPASNELDIGDFVDQDIRRYPEAEMLKRSKYGTEENFESQYGDLAGAIVQRAQGVFLWVSLIVDWLSEGLEEHDEFDDLWARLESIPVAMTDYFQDIFKSINPNHHRVTIHVLLVLCQSGPEGLPIVTIDQMMRRLDRPSMVIQEPLSKERYSPISEPPSKRLDARFKGLLVVSEAEQPGEFSPIRWDRTYNLRFAHGTMKKFVETGDLGVELRNKLPRSLDALEELISALLLHMRSLPAYHPESGDEPLLQSYLWALRLIFDCQRKTDAVNDSASVAQNDEVGRVMAAHIPFVPPRDGSNFSLDLSKPSPDEGFLAFALAMRLNLYVKAKLSGRSIRTRIDGGRPLLDYVLCGIEQVPSPWRAGWIISSDEDDLRHHDADLVDFLLDRGADPNEDAGDDTTTTVWGHFLTMLSLYNETTHFRYESRQTTFYQTQALLRYGADNTLLVDVVRGWSEKQKVDAVTVLRDTFTEEQFEMLGPLLRHKPFRT